MRLKSIVDEDFINYKLPSMYIAFPFCTFKCEKEANVACCHNSFLAHAKVVEYDDDTLIKRYLKNKVSKAIVCCGLEPLDSFDELLAFLDKFRNKYHCMDDFVIYTGYNKDEILDKIEILKQYPNIIVKYGRFVPSKARSKDEVLGVTLASPNQKAEKIS